VVINLLLRYLVSIVNQINNLGLDLYTSPFYRLFDFLLGMLVAKLFMNRRLDNKKSYTLYEFTIIGVFIIIYILTFAISIDGTLYAAFFIVAIYVIAQENGYISNLLKLEILQKNCEF